MCVTILFRIFSLSVSFIYTNLKKKSLLFLSYMDVILGSLL